MDFYRRVMVAVADPSAAAELLGYARLLRHLAPDGAPAAAPATAPDASTHAEASAHGAGNGAIQASSSRGAGATAFRFVHIMGHATTIRSRSGAMPTHRDALQALRHAVQTHVGAPAGPEHCFVFPGDRTDGLLQFAAEWGADLLLVGHRRTATGQRSTVRRLAMKAPCSLWMVPDGSRCRLARVMAAVDFSASSAHALATATLLASRAGLPECVALHVRVPGALSGDAAVDTAVDAAPNAIAAQQGDEQAFHQFVEPLDAHGVTVRLRTVESGSIAAAIGRLAVEERVDLVVAGTRGLSPSAAILLGSESEQLLREATGPILVTKPRGARPGLLEALLDRNFRSDRRP